MAGNWWIVLLTTSRICSFDHRPQDASLTMCLCVNYDVDDGNNDAEMRTRDLVSFHQSRPMGKSLGNITGGAGFRRLVTEYVRVGGTCKGG